MPAKHELFNNFFRRNRPITEEKQHEEKITNSLNQARSAFISMTNGERRSTEIYRPGEKFDLSRLNPTDVFCIRSRRLGGSDNMWFAVGAKGEDSICAYPDNYPPNQRMDIWWLKPAIEVPQLSPADQHYLEDGSNLRLARPHSFIYRAEEMTDITHDQKLWKNPTKGVIHVEVYPATEALSPVEYYRLIGNQAISK